MKAKWLACLVMFTAALCVTRVNAAVTKTTWPDAATMQFVFVENNSDDNFFVTPGGGLDPRMTGANRWTGLKYNGSGTIYQQSLGYIDNGYNTGLYANWFFDMWLDNSPASHPLQGLRCINWYAGCDMATSLILPQTSDASGFYGATVTPGGQKWMPRHDVRRFLPVSAADVGGQQLLDDHQLLHDVGELRRQQRRAL
ncbi:CFA/I fimbrial minor adhesin [Klebsiella michiganensis]|nr:CFA/I fimbrial minor adhesin [Klebsiella michiganensis]